MDVKGNDALLKTSRVTEWTVNNSGYLTFLFAGFLLAGCLSAYVIAVARGNVDAFLPLISDAAGSPPQNGIFGTLVCLGGMIGVVFMIVRYMIVLEQNQEKSKLVTLLNKTSMAMGVLSMCGITLVAGYPMNFYRNKDVWLNDVGLPHMIGGVMIFAFGLVYIAIQCALTLFLSAKDRTILFLRVAICMICTASFVYHMVTVPDNFGGISHYYFNNSTEEASGSKQIAYPLTLGSSLKLPIDTSGNYVSSAITEWVLVFFFCGFFLTFFKETQEYSLLVVIETQMSEEESMNDLSTQPNGKGVGARRESEIKTVFRRDSTCQTVLDSVESGELKKPATTTALNGKYTKRQVSSFEMLAGDKLEKLIESRVKKSKSDIITSTTETGTDASMDAINGDEEHEVLTSSNDSNVNGNVPVSAETSEEQITPISEKIEEVKEEIKVNDADKEVLENVSDELPNGKHKETEDITNKD